MIVLKKFPEDFVVREIPDMEFKDGGAFTYFELTKRNFTTLRALSVIAQALHVPLKRLGYAGTKDKRAVTAQLCSVEGIPAERLDSLQLTGLQIRSVGQGDRPVSLGMLKGNMFALIVRGIRAAPEPRARFTNYFGEQRFSERNPLIGAAIVRRKFDAACAYLIQEEGEWSDPVKSYLASHVGDYIGALRTLPKKLLLMFVHAYQALLWNRAAAEWSQRPAPPETLPIPGFGTQQVDEVMQRILAQESLSLRDFIVRGLPELSAEGGERRLFEEAQDLQIGPLEQDEATGAKKVQLTFFLPKSCYATVFVRELFGEKRVPGTEGKT